RGPGHPGTSLARPAARAGEGRADLVVHSQAHEGRGTGNASQTTVGGGVRSPYRGDDGCDDTWRRCKKECRETPLGGSEGGCVTARSAAMSAVVLTLALSACDIPIPEVPPTPALQLSSAVTGAQSSIILAETFAELQAADASQDPELLSTR